MAARNSVILYADGSGYVGEVCEGRRHGRGTYIHHATDVQYDGEWFQDMWDGEGRLYSVHDMSVLHGLWRKGELVDQGLRKDVGTGCVWAEEYREGQLVNHGLVAVHDLMSSSESGEDSVSKHRTPHDDHYDFLRYTRVARPMAERDGPHSTLCPCKLSAPQLCQWLRERAPRRPSKSLLKFIADHALTWPDIDAHRYTIAQLGHELELERIRDCVRECHALHQAEDHVAQQLGLIYAAVSPDFIIPMDELHFEHALGPPDLASTYKGRWMGKSVAIKVFSGHLIDPQAWITYCNVISRLNHPNLVQVLGVAMKPPYIWCVVREYVPQGSLAAVLRTHQPSFTPLANVASGSSMPLTFDPGVERWNDNLTVLAAAGSSVECTHRGHHLDALLRNELLIGSHRRPPPRPRKLRTDTCDIMVILKYALQGLIYIHNSREAADAPLCHGNLKPSNMLLSDQLKTRLSDACEHLIERAFQPFVLDLDQPARCPRCERSTRTLQVVPSIQKRSVNYLAPECLCIPVVCKGATFEADVYSFALTAAALLVRRTPYANLSSTQVRVVRGFSDIAPQIVDQLWEPLRSVIQRCVSTDCKERVASWKSLSDILLHYKHTAAIIAENALIGFITGS